MLFGEVLELGDARISYDTLSPLDLARPVAAIVDDLGEDLLQIACANGDIVDVGWYPAWNEQGRLGGGDGARPGLGKAAVQRAARA